MSRNTQERPLAGKVALVTGGSRGIGAAIASAQRGRERRGRIERKDEMKVNIGKERFGPWALITGPRRESARNSRGKSQRRGST